MNNAPVFNQKEWEDALKSLIEVQVAAHKAQAASQDTPQGDEITGSHGVPGNPEDHLDQEVGSYAMGNPNRSICDSGPKSLYDAANRQATMDLPAIPPEPEEDPDPAIMPAPERPSGTINVTLVHERRVIVPKEVMPWDDEEI